MKDRSARIAIPPTTSTTSTSQYDDFVDALQREVRQAGAYAIMSKLYELDLLTANVHPEDLRKKTSNFDEEIEWTWFYLWHHEGRRARHGAAMMAPDYTHWHGMYEVAERFYMELIPQARELVEHGKEVGLASEAARVEAGIDEILARPEHSWFEDGAEDQAEQIREEMERRYGSSDGGPADSAPEQSDDESSDADSSESDEEDPSEDAEEDE